MLVGVRGAAAPGAGAAVFSAAANGRPPSVPTIDPFAPGVATASMFSDLPPDTQLIVPVILWPPPGSVCVWRRAVPPSVSWLLVKLTNCPD